jgi:hypothetical protein
MFVVSGLCGDGDEWLEKNAILRPQSRGKLQLGGEKFCCLSSFSGSLGNNQMLIMKLLFEVFP